MQSRRDPGIPANKSSFVGWEHQGATTWHSRKNPKLFPKTPWIPSSVLRETVMYVPP
jgi:hypothetical protein